MLELLKHAALNLCALVLLGVSMGGCSAPESPVEEFRADFISNLGHEPIFSWKFSGNQEGFNQSFYQIMARNCRPEQRIMQRSGPGMVLMFDLNGASHCVL